MKVLVADDDRSYRILARRELGRLGYEVETARHGEEVLHKLSEIQQPVLLVLDRTMPRLDGLGLCRILSQEDEDCPVRFILMISSHSTPEDRLLCLRAGADAFLAKPFAAMDLAQALDQVRHRLERGA